MSEPSAALAETLQLHQAGNLEKAEQGYRRILRLDPFHADALHLLGLVSHQRGRCREAVGLINRAIAVDGRKAEYHANLGNAYSSLGQTDDALECFQQAVHLAPKLAPVHLCLGRALLQRNDFLGAEAHFQQALRLEPRMSDAHFELGNVRLSQQRYREALSCFSSVLEIEPRRTDALNNLGITLAALGERDQALAAYRLAIQLQPDFDQSWNNLGVLYQSGGLLENAELAFRQALEVAPRNAAAENNLGTVLQARELAELAESCFRRALAHEPMNAATCGNLAGALQVQGKLDESRSCYERSLGIRFDARLAIEAALMLPPAYDSIEHLRECRTRLRTNVERLVAQGVTLDPARETIPVSFLLAFQGENDRDLQQLIARLYVPVRNRDALSLIPRNRADGRIRVGFVSKFLRNHAIGDLTGGIIRELSRQDFHVTVMAPGATQDSVAATICQSADATVVLPERISAARETIAELGCDVLIYPDLGMDPFCTTLAWSRLAKVQCTSWGHPVTSGIPTVDYFVSSDLLELPGADTHYTEKLVRLPVLPTSYTRPAVSPSHVSRTSFGFPADINLYVCPQSLFKFHPEFDAMLAEILERDAHARIVLVEAPHRHWTELLSRRLQITLANNYSRVQFVPRMNRDEFLRLLNLADVVLDPLHFGGGNTTYQALALGTPVVTLPSNYLRGRVTAGCYRQMGLTCCVAADAADYVELALRLGTDREYNAAARVEITNASPLLFDAPRAVREFEAFLQNCVGLSPH